MNSIEIAIIEDQEDYRNTLRMMIDATPRFMCLNTYPSGELALSGISSNPPDIVMVDLGLPGISGTECIRQLKEMVPKIQFMVLTIKSEDREVFNALKAGATAYLLKDTPPSKILESIQELYNGGAPMSAQIARLVVESFQKPTKTGKNPYKELVTNREKEVLELLARGLLYKEISSELNISIETVKCHCHNIYEKLHASNRTEALNKYFRGGNTNDT